MTNSVKRICSYRNCDEESGDYAKCDYHRRMRRKSDQARKENRQKKGVCTRCGKNPNIEDTNLCQICTAKKSTWSKDFRVQRLNKGLCYRCSSPSNKSICEKCANKVEIREEKRLKRGICPKCGNTEKLKNNKVCFNCWIKYKAYDFLGSRKRYKEILNLWNSQRGCCAYTGAKLVPGIDAHLDHKTPISKGGAGDIENLQWVERRINLLKDTQTHNEFISDIPYIIKQLKEIINVYGKSSK